MASVIDVAKIMVNESIKLARESETSEAKCYLVDMIKLNNLLYLAQCYMLSFYEAPLFREEIRAYTGGAYIRKVDSIWFEKGFGPINSVFTSYFPVTTYTRLEVIREILRIFGKLGTDELVFFVRNTQPFDVFRNSEGTGIYPEITIEEHRMAELENSFIWYKKYGFWI